MPSPMPAAVATLVEARAHCNCEAMIPGVCNLRGEHLHHRLMRSQGGQHTAANLIHVCHLCHQWIHAHPARAYKLGLLVRSTHTPHNTPIYRRRRWCTLTDAGDITEGEPS